ncbi:MAG: retroviral-like aspartic protease family protein [Treponema sp.]|nr:retroviral-like aspartic protease family protein [Treponema sp.]
MDKWAITYEYKKGISASIVIPVRLRVKHSDVVTEFWIINALIDTGASISCISNRLANKMGLISTGSYSYGTAAGEYKFLTYTADVFFPRDKLFKDLAVSEFKVRDIDDYDFLIGMDILVQGNMSITNTEEKMIFSFRIPPSGKHIDYQIELLREEFTDEEIETLIKESESLPKNWWD